MIIFLNLRNQICDGYNAFAFYDTVSDTICSFGEYGEQVFSSVESFKREYKDNHRPIDRFLNLIPKDYFEPNDR